jgi:hypothetical protein
MQKHRPRHSRLRTTHRNADPDLDLDGIGETLLARSDTVLLESALDCWVRMVTETTSLLLLAREKRTEPDGEQLQLLRGRFVVALRRGGKAMRQFRAIVAAMDEPLRARLWLRIAGGGDPEPRPRCNIPTFRNHSASTL